MNCSPEDTSNSFAACGEAACEVCYPEESIRKTTQDLLDANDTLRKRAAAKSALQEQLEAAKDVIEALKTTLIWLGSSQLTGDTVEVLKSEVRKAAVEAVTRATSAMQEESPDVQRQPDQPN
jgi:hypothetical protein